MLKWLKKKQQYVGTYIVDLRNTNKLYIIINSRHLTFATSLR